MARRNDVHRADEAQGLEASIRSLPGQWQWGPGVRIVRTKLYHAANISSRCFHFLLPEPIVCQRMLSAGCPCSRPLREIVREFNQLLSLAREEAGYSGSKRLNCFVTPSERRWL